MMYAYNGKSPSIAEGCYIAPSADVIGNVTLGEGVSIWFHATLRADVNTIHIGGQSNLQDNVVAHVDKGFPLIVGERCTIGHGAIIHACTIEDDCLIGMGAIVLNGAVIGKESIVAAGALVSQNKVYPPRSLLVGTPAKLIRTLSDEEFAKVRENTQEYWEFAHDLATGKQTIN
ncbi:gamma carbonic anhydrase family protein [uncultured Sphaerochaeta sp.]|uniref:gamma carbonic anhydrase family protein n=1 Tax=uncultured Sphaerochaeta sp. TaxID=886478 RepID=UPI0029CA2EBD|nr:gamma carbonic anhydrase family protein [uncultured Sphaerochaeta sp.]